jgi:ABC-type lipoprotein export system ATPase subunit
MDLFVELNKAGTTIVQVTHSEENARYSKRIIELRDGWMTRDEAPHPFPTEVGAQ